MSALSPPVARAHMLIRRPASQVYGAFIDPAVTSRFWFTRGSGKLVRGDKITWHWDMYGFSAQVDVRELEQDRRILIGWPTPVEWLLSPEAGTPPSSPSPRRVSPAPTMSRSLQRSTPWAASASSLRVVRPGWSMAFGSISWAITIRIATSAAAPDRR